MIKPNTISDEKRFEIAEDLLRRYARAKFVITSRIHCALPCLALGTPVVFINSFQDKSNLSRLEGLIDLFNYVNVDIKTGKYTSNFPLPEGKITTSSVLPNPSNYLSLSEKLKKRCTQFITKADKI